MAKWKLGGENGLLRKIGRRNIIIICAVLLIGGAVCLNYFVFSDPAKTVGYGDNNMEEKPDGTSTSGTVDTDAYFTAAALSRQQARDESLEVLQTVLASADALEETKTQALNDISRIAQQIEQESNVEALVKAKGFEECVAVINGESASVIVRSASALLQNQAAQIGEIVYEQTGILPANVKILCK